jgi:leucyl/phenylalanyl-tRNA---protein transferase
MVFLNDQIWFPSANQANEDGLLAMGGDLCESRLILAYRKGIFPWFTGYVPLWWCPDPRFVLFPEKLHISKSLHQSIRKGQFSITRNQAFEQVIQHCAGIFRPGQQDTWITKGMIKAFAALHHQGHAISFEAWQGNRLVGGLYGVLVGNVYCGESMFSLVSNASKVAFVHAVQQLRQQGVTLIDCQVHTEHLESLGAEMIPRSRFLDLLNPDIVPAPMLPESAHIGS